MEEAVLERPIPSEVIPAVVFIFPSAMPQFLELRCGNFLGVQGRAPEPRVLGGFLLPLLPPAVGLGDGLL